MHFLAETLCPGIHVDVTLAHTTSPNIFLPDQVHPFMARVFPGGGGHFQQDNDPDTAQKRGQECFEEHDKEFKQV